MKITKSEEILISITRDILSGKLKSGMGIVKRDYPYAGSQTMQLVFRVLAENDVITQKIDNTYILTDNCITNIKDMFIDKISEYLDIACEYACAADFSENDVINIVKYKMKKDK